MVLRGQVQASGAKMTPGSLGISGSAAALILEMRADHATIQQIADKLLVSTSTVFRYLNGAIDASDVERIVMPAWPLTGWQIRALEIREIRHETARKTR